ncbi:MAG: hypothetical protein JSV66_19145 [Trueperaceae bacterium]|nr:MAG: hypothetical protein JSV66_19145 [Trueperaceae bacterium]
MSTRLCFSLMALSLLLLVACGDLVDKPDPQTAVLEDHEDKGLVFHGLAPGESGSLCEGMFAIQSEDERPLCSHGPDPAPDGVDITRPLSLSELQGELSVTASSDIPCIGDGVSGNRVQAVYVVASDKADRFSEVEPLIEGWAAQVSQMFQDSAAQVGGESDVRWVTDSACDLDVLHVVVSPGGDDDFASTVSEMKELGHSSPERKYLMWVDARVYCGIAQIYGDDRPGQDNYNNGRTAMFARVDEGCWNQTHSVAAHELVHSLGGVQLSAPHATGGYHCTDEYDRLCVRDGSDVVLTYDCPSGNEGMLDCNNDDYFHPNPPANSYLDTHWNVAHSSFLTSGSSAYSSTSTATVEFGSSLNEQNGSRSFTITPGAGTVDAELTFKWRRGVDAPILTLEILEGETVIAGATGGTPVSLSQEVAGGRITLRVSGADRTAFTLTVGYPTP